MGRRPEDPLVHDSLSSPRTCLQHWGSSFGTFTSSACETSSSIPLFSLESYQSRRTLSGVRINVLGPGQFQDSGIRRYLEIEVGPSEFNVIPWGKGFVHLFRRRVAQCHPSMSPSFQLQGKTPIYRSKGAGDNLLPPSYKEQHRRNSPAPWLTSQVHPRALTARSQVIGRAVLFHTST